ncbi:PE family protein [Mycobacterium sp. 852002-51057_SCH5723018]|uniref:PE family protein n=1 Tax=Mycobacterium sp. 852002-51057_SCH5723018 TaxID=1834094 RepID=UPI0007FF3BE0|nr:PE family protein [Mycobacterium sp. 852002-51057_SCH5723018]OBG27191.1 hypothetical protein A5764_00425 [Mycobacterium sp. 852002-51057_SCH5723018]
MSLVIAVPELVQAAAQDLAGLQTSLAEAAAYVVGPTTGVVPAAADEVSAAISAMFGNFGQQFQSLSAQARAFHAEFVNLMNAGAGAYLSTEVANVEQALANAVSAPVETLLGGGAAPGAAAAGNGLLGLLGLGGTTTTGSAASLLGIGSGSGLLGTGGLTGATSPLSGLLGGLTGGTSPLSGLLGGLTGGPSPLSGLLGGVGGLGLPGGVLGSLGNLGSLGTNLGSLLTTALPGLPTTLAGLANSSTPIANSLLPGLLNLQAGSGPFFTGIAGPYDALVYNTWNNLQSLVGGWLADPFPFLRQFVANQMVYGQTIATALQTGNFQPVSAIPGQIAQNFFNVVHTLTDTSVTPSLDVTSLTPPSVTLDNAVGLQLVFGASLMGPPAVTLEAAGYSASTFASAVQAGNASAAFAALIDAPAVIANGFLNGEATFPYALNLSSLTGPVVGNIANLSVAADFPLDGILHPPGYYPVTATVTILDGSVLPPIDVNVGTGSTPFSGLLPFLINYAPQQLAQAIGAPAAPPPLISIPLLTF